MRFSVISQVSNGTFKISQFDLENDYNQRKKIIIEVSNAFNCCLKLVKSLLTFIYYLKRHKSFFLKNIEDLVVLLIKDILRFQMFKIILISF